MKTYILLIGLLVAIQSRAQEEVRDYQPYYAGATYNESDVIVLRSFERLGTRYFFMVDCHTLQTQIIPAKNVKAKVDSWSNLKDRYTTTPYVKALTAAESRSFALQDAGIVHGYPKEHGITLTVDLCPSHKPLDRVVFTALIAEFAKIEKPVPVALSLSGRFMLTHLEDLHWLKSLEAEGYLKITWVNHTYNHHYEPQVPLQENFLLKPGTDINFEVLETEIAMITQGLCPSVFFRFPGLVSDNAIVSKITGFGLIPIGSDAWLAKGQQSAPGSIVLIHGNGNEPVGVSDFIHLLESKKDFVLQKEWLMYDLRESVAHEFED